MNSFVRSQVISPFPNPSVGRRLGYEHLVQQMEAKFEKTGLMSQNAVTLYTINTVVMGSNRKNIV